MLRITCMILLLLTFFARQSPAAERVYKWVDENNVTHFSSRPPMNQENLEVIPVSEELDEPDEDDSQKAAEVEPPRIELPPVNDEPQLVPGSGSTPAMENEKPEQQIENQRQPDKEVQGTDETKAIPGGDAGMETTPFSSVPVEEQLDK